MGLRILCLGVLGSFFFSLSAQEVNQDSIGAVFFTHILSEQYDEAWAMLQSSPQQELGRSSFLANCKQIKSLAGEEREVKYFINTMIMGQDGRPKSQKIYKLKSNHAAGMEGLLLSVSFLSAMDQSIASFQWTIQQAVPQTEFQVREEILGESAVWEVEKEAINIHQIVLAHAGDQAMLVIKLYRELDDDQLAQLKEEAIPIIKKAVRLGWYKAASKKLRKKEVDLLANIGVAFINPQSGTVQKVQLTPSEYRK